LEANAKPKFKTNILYKYSNIKKYVTKRFDIESAKINSIAILIGILTGLVVGIYDRALLYFSAFLGCNVDFQYTNSSLIM
jgi:chloride channel protein, CIC family